MRRVEDEGIINYTTAEEVWGIIRKLENGKALGHDGISNKA